MAGLRRFFVENINEYITIDGEEFRHAVSVLRIKVGEDIIVCDNSGYDYRATITKINKKDFEVKVGSKQLGEAEPKNSVTLICGYLKGDKTELVVQKAVELGVKNIVVFNSEFCSAYMNDNKLARLNRVSVESAKQCGRSIAPPVIYKDNFKDALACGNNCNTKLFACEFATKSDAPLSKTTKSTAIVVGSEGGFSKEESEIATAMGYNKIFLGSRILRAETASIVLCGVVMHLLGELE